VCRGNSVLMDMAVAVSILYMFLNLTAGPGEQQILPINLLPLLFCAASNLSW